MTKLHIDVEGVRYLHRNLDCQIVLIGLSIDLGNLVKNELSLFLGCTVQEINLKVTAREDANTLSSLIVAQFNPMHEFRLNLDLRNELHLKLGDFFVIKFLAISGAFSIYSCCDFDETRHTPNIIIAHILHHTEEALQVVDFPARLHKLRIVTLASNSNLLSDQSDSIELGGRHGFFRLLI